MFSNEFCEISKNTFSNRTPPWLLLCSRISEKIEIVVYLLWTQCFMVLKNFLLRPKKLGNRSGKNKWNHFSKHFQKINQELGTTKFPLQASQVTYKLCWFSSMMSSCIFYIQSVSFIILLLGFNDFYFLFWYFNCVLLT